MDWKDLVISSKMVVDIRELPYGMSDGAGYLELRTATVTTELEQLDKEREARAIPWWIIVLSAVAGVLLLLLLIFILWKVRTDFKTKSKYLKYIILIISFFSVGLFQAQATRQGHGRAGASQIRERTPATRRAALNLIERCDSDSSSAKLRRASLTKCSFIILIIIAQSLTYYPHRIKSRRRRSRV